MLSIRRLKEISKDELEGILNRGQMELESVLERVAGILKDVKEKKDLCLLEMLRDVNPKAEIKDLVVHEEEFEEAFALIGKEVKAAIQKAMENIKRFHEAQVERAFWADEIRDGMLLGRMNRPLERVGCYIPGGRAPYPSTVLMTVIPAKVAGVSEIYLTTPVGADLKVNPTILVAAKMAGATKVFKVGGPWGIGAFAYGTETVPKVYKIVGPGNKYVTAAKLLVYGKVDIDSPAGPSEGLILADETARPDFVAWDLISQLEHDPDASALLVTTSMELAQQVSSFLEKLVLGQPKRDVIMEAMAKNCHIIVSENMDQALSFVNDYAPEHLEIHCKIPFEVLFKIKNAGSIFLGDYAPIAVGDYASGTNHVLPTGGAAKVFSGLSVDSFIKSTTFQHLSKGGLEEIKNAILTLSKVEGLEAHGGSVLVRLEGKTD